MDPEGAADRGSDPRQVVGVTGHDQIAARECAYDDHGVNQIARAALRERNAGGPCPGLSQRLDVAAEQEPRELRLWTSSPDLAKHAG